MGITWKHILQIKTIELKFYIILTEYYEIMKSVINIQLFFYYQYFKLYKYRIEIKNKFCLYFLRIQYN
ncbi:LOW QUALITY PROTEIN: hypothetical protein PFUGPA_01664 [Plasmodium falciparum Palo Alto/Uganda]|uniref:Uncharacterized protein n=1 Tax=Plasmodium falciparum (isolate Palo Alto / Uganda) TaxID=57270 RepID=W4J415_PLAFP|nr:LOW QUALITY PROTEIN: hypothetical protein PFUGPA_01664 [Plasmodium falciparum Palo Alto/Uganda]